MRITGQGRLSDFLGDFVVYRNLEPADARLAGLRARWRELGLDHYYIPRKTELEYARAVALFLKDAHALEHPGGRPPEWLLYIGDTLMNDVTAIENFATLGDWQVLGFIANENLNVEKTVEVKGITLFTNRWSGLVDFLRYLQERDFPVDERMVVVVDMDKTAIGARGRNDKPIDEARVDAVRETAALVLGDEFREEVFRPIYDQLKQPQYHYFTRDNQDYLTYICLMLSAGVYEFQSFLKALGAKELKSFPEFVAECGRRLEKGGFPGLSRVHAEVHGNMSREDPTPFKTFRYREYLTTLARMGVGDGKRSLPEILGHDIVITKEVEDMCRFLSERGVVLFTISDKPDEASVPSPEQAARGYQPLHRVLTRVVGHPIYEALREV